MNEDFKESLGLIVEWLPQPEQEVVTRLYWERASMRDIARQLDWVLPGGDVDVKRVERTSEKAFRRIRALLEYATDLGFETGVPQEWLR